MKRGRPVLRWHGGKFLLAPWIIQHFPPHRAYTEAFGGAASVLLRKAPSHAEIYNDLDQQVVGLFRVLRDERLAPQLIQALLLTPFDRSEFNLSYCESDDPVEQARRLVVRSFMGFGSDGATGEYRTGFRSNSNRRGTTPAHDWRNYPEALIAIVERLDYLEANESETAHNPINHSRHADQIAVNLVQFEQKCGEQRLSLPCPMNELKRLLRGSKSRKFLAHKPVNSRIEKTVNCWVFQRPGTTPA